MKRNPRHVFGPRKKWISVALVLCLSAGVLVVRADNLLPAASFAEGPAGWTASGNGTWIEVNAARAYGDGAALRIEDHGPQIGQAQSDMIAVDPDRRYFVSLRLRLDDDLPARVVIDLQSFTVDRDVRGGARPIGAVEGRSGWVHVMRTVKPRDGAAFVRLRVIPAAGDPGTHGACWIDEIVLKPVEAISDDDLGLTETTPAHRRVESPPAVVATDSGAPFDFEDLEGWTVRHGTAMQSITFERSHLRRREGRAAGHLTYQTPMPGQSIVFVPPSPLLVEEDFDTITLWIHQHFFSFVTANVPWEIGPTPRVLVEDADGKRHEVRLSRVVWQNWSVARAKLSEVIEVPARLVGIALDNLPACHDISGASGTPVLAPRHYALDALAFGRTGTGPLDLPSPVPAALASAPSMRPPATEILESAVRQIGEDYVFAVRRGNYTTRFTYRPVTGLTSDLTLNVDGGGTVVPLAGQGVRFEHDGTRHMIDDPTVTRELIDCVLADDVVTARWSCHVDGRTVEVTYRLALEGGSLALGVRLNEAVADAFVSGPIEADAVEGVFVPFLNWNGWTADYTVHRVNQRIVISRYGDLHRSDFANVTFDGRHRVHTYGRLTDGSRHALNETWLITASTRLADVLPVIPHPVNDAARRFAAHVYARDLIPYRTERDRAGGLAYLRLCRRYGIDRLMIKMTHLGADHDDWGLRAAMNVYDQVPRSTEGGVEAFAQYVKDVQALGFKALLYTDYHQLDPLSEFWNDDHAVQDSSGNWVDSWRHCYRFSPVAAVDATETMTRRVVQRFGVDGTYLDESGSFPWGATTDYDARKPGAALARVAHAANVSIPLAEQRIHGGPSYGEGGAQWLWAGFLSGAYGQTYWSSWDAPTAWLVDFELRRVHPLMTNLSMGYALSRYGGLPGEDLDWAHDRFQAAAIAFGRAGCFKVPFQTQQDHQGMARPRWIWHEKRRIFRQYFPIQALQAAYALVPVASIHYEADGQWHEAAEALAKGMLDRNHVRVVYANGLHVYVNGSTDATDVWDVERRGQRYQLPQNGHLYVNEATDLLGFGALLDGHRVDFVDSRRYLYADARGSETDFGVLRTKGCVVIRRDADKGPDVVLVSGDTVTLDPQRCGLGAVAVDRIIALDEQERAVATRSIRSEGGRLRLEASENVISYRCSR